ncbi:hypothetical protein [Gemmata sp.]|uniref:hypothetical protein n=1 Tax=Gemmata sp. TaxID=1914242 RepID=UPI003F71ABF8
MTTVAAVAGAVFGAVGGAAAASLAGGYYTTAAGSLGAMLGSGCAAAVAWCVVPQISSRG